MLTIRLQRTGKKNSAQFRVVLTDHRKTSTSGEMEVLGNLDPHTKILTINEERLKYWLEKGAQTSNTMRDWLVKKGLLEKKVVKFTKKFAKKTKKVIAAAAEKAKKAKEEVAKK